MPIRRPAISPFKGSALSKTSGGIIFVSELGWDGFGAELTLAVGRCIVLVALWSAWDGFDVGTWVTRKLQCRQRRGHRFFCGGNFFIVLWSWVTWDVTFIAVFAAVEIRGSLREQMRWVRGGKRRHRDQKLPEQRDKRELKGDKDKGSMSHRVNGMR
ncbi:hypothetical protein C8J56DRAFT_903721 [Mycena floridula]|nr:hypothetical protein C8J56DRAFT_903721 [Mycena floridula]